MRDGTFWRSLIFLGFFASAVLVPGLCAFDVEDAFSPTQS
jgi:hypothetical protein